MKVSIQNIPETKWALIIQQCVHYIAIYRHDCGYNRLQVKTCWCALCGESSSRSYHNTFWCRWRLGLGLFLGLGLGLGYVLWRIGNNDDNGSIFRGFGGIQECTWEAGIALTFFLTWKGIRAHHNHEFLKPIGSVIIEYLSSWMLMSSKAFCSTISPDTMRRSKQALLSYRPFVPFSYWDVDS